MKKMNISNTKIGKKSNKINWKKNFNMQMFRYSFLKQIKSVTTWVTLAYICLNSTPNSKIESIQKQAIKIADSYKVCLFMLLIMSFVWIGIRSLQIFRDEMDDGTLLIFSSMPYTRLRLIFQKWLSFQIIWMMTLFCIIFLTPTIILGFSSFTELNREILKVLLKTIYRPLTASWLIMLLISTAAILVSIFFGKVGTIGICWVASFISLILLFVPTLITSTSLKDISEMKLLNKIETLNQLEQNDDLFKHLNDPELLNLFW